MRAAFSSPVFYLALTLLAFSAGQWVNKKTGSPLANPLLIGCILVGAYLVLVGVPLEEYNEGGGVLTLCLTPATISLALPIYRQFEVLKKHLLPILAGAFMGSLASIGSVYVFGKLFGLDAQLICSLLPKSVTTPIGVALSESMGGLTAVTAIAIVFTGIVGAVFLPTALKLLGIQHPVVTGIAIGIAGLITAVLLSVGAAAFL